MDKRVDFEESIEFSHTIIIGSQFEISHSFSFFDSLSDFLLVCAGQNFFLDIESRQLFLQLHVCLFEGEDVLVFIQTMLLDGS